MDKDKFFISIGPPKTGTSWLYEVLKKHPQVELPNDKEIRYFWAKEHLGKNNLCSNLFGKHWHYRNKRKKFKSTLRSTLNNLSKMKTSNIRNLFWHINYFCGTQNDKWYESLFPNNKVSGDITPKYCELSTPYIEKVKKLIPNCKIIISLRDPIDREWSRVKMNLLKRQNHEKISEVDEISVLNHFKNPLQYKSNDYNKLIEKWSKYFDKDQIMVFYYDELKENPQLLFNKICKFLNIETVEIRNVNQKVNKGIVQEVPEKYLKTLVDLNYQYIKKFAETNPNKYSLEWLEKYETDFNTN